MPQVFIAPRGLISVLLYFAIPDDFLINDFETGLLLFIILGTSILMAWALVHYKLGKTGRLRRVAKVKSTLQMNGHSQDVDVYNKEDVNANR